MRDESTDSELYFDNFADERREREVEKYGSRLPLAEMAARPIRDTRHSIEPAYGNYDRPISGIV